MPPLPMRPTASDGSSRVERLAVNVLDLDRVDPLVRARMLLPNLAPDKVVRPFEKEPDETGVEFCCDLLQAALVCDLLRNHDRQLGDAPTRVYLRKRVWSKVSPSTLLTTVRNGKAVLNPEVFPEEVKPVAIVRPIIVRPITLGKRSDNGEAGTDS